MNTIRKITSLVLVTALFYQCEKDHDLEREVNIPDSNFLEVLFNEGVDTNNDGQISYAEAEQVSSLYFSGGVCINCTGYCESRLEIRSLEGIEAFVNLRNLSFSCTTIEKLSLTKHPHLAHLSCNLNKLKSLDISECYALKELIIGGNQLTTIDVTNNTNLEFFSCYNNQLTTIDVTYNTALEDFRCFSNQLTSIDVTHNTALKIFNCGSNQLTGIDLSSNKALTDLAIYEMPTLNQICVWEMPFPPPGVEIHTTGSPNVSFTLDCN